MKAKATKVVKKAKVVRRAAPKAETSLVLRTCTAQMTSYGGFQWPDKVGAKVQCDDFSTEPCCGQGLHGWLYGAGDQDASNNTFSTDARWLVVEVRNSEIVMLGGKCKFPRCVIRHIGDHVSAAAYIIANEPKSASVAVIGANLIVGDKENAAVGARGTATAGYRGTATAGYSGTATAGDSGTATAGYRGTATAGDSGTATAGDSGTATAGYRGTATAGDSGTATAGYSGTATAGALGAATAGALGTATAGARGTATAGYSGTATAGYRGTATAGALGTATAGDSGTATAGALGEIRVRWYDYANSRYRTAIGYVGEAGILPNTKYRLDGNNKFVAA